LPDKTSDPHGTAADHRTYETPALEVLGTVEELAAANEDSLQDSD
jgi:hypothetical protein